LAEVFPGTTTLFHLGPCGNLSPRYHVKSQTFAEASRLGRLLGDAIAKTIQLLTSFDFADDQILEAAHDKAELVPNVFPSVGAAEESLREARGRFEILRAKGVAHGLLRTAECIVFGCEEQVTLAKAQASGEVARLQSDLGLAEVQVLRIGNLFLVAMPGEQFVEYGLEIKRRAPGRTFVISVANGELQGYIVTPEAAAAGGYEAAFALFRPESGDRLVKTAVHLMKKLLHDSVH
jgi:hypothetical protein